MIAIFLCGVWTGAALMFILMLYFWLNGYIEFMKSDDLKRRMRNNVTNSRCGKLIRERRNA